MARCSVTSSPRAIRQQPGGPGGQLTDGAGAPHGHDVARSHPAQVGADPAGGGGVGGEHRPLVADLVRHPERADVGERHPDVLGVAAQVATHRVRVAEAAAGRLAPTTSR
ncbi:hypothetical protein [Actinoplanes nipponensis]|uniref:hypothetical protein n=1 Tax=Actinoplanes nipponensis TaxID=135950 RepID=UPI001940756B|nr:hypothetical protein [Actinoplanes nipponensis]